MIKKESSWRTIPFLKISRLSSARELTFLSGKTGLAKPMF